MLIFLAYKPFPSLKQNNHGKKRCHACHSVTLCLERVTKGLNYVSIFAKVARKVVFLPCPTKKIEKNYFISEILSIFAE